MTKLNNVLAVGGGGTPPENPSGLEKINKVVTHTRKAVSDALVLDEKSIIDAFVAKEKFEPKDFEGLPKECRGKYLILEVMKKAQTFRFIDQAIDTFSDLDIDVARKVMELNEWHFIAKRLDKFQGLDHKDFAKALINKGDQHRVVFNIDKFQELDQEIAEMLIALKLGFYVACNIDKFQGLDDNKIAKLLIDAGDWLYVAYEFEKFKKLDQEIIDLLTKPGQESTKYARRYLK